MAEDHLVVGYQLRGIHYSITVERHTGNDGRTVLIQVEDKTTADQWKATFEKQCNLKIAVIYGYIAK